MISVLSGDMASYFSPEFWFFSFFELSLTLVSESPSFLPTSGPLCQTPYSSPLPRSSPVAQPSVTHLCSWDLAFLQNGREARCFLLSQCFLKYIFSFLSSFFFACCFYVVHIFLFVDEEYSMRNFFLEGCLVLGAL